MEEQKNVFINCLILVSGLFTSQFIIKKYYERKNQKMQKEQLNLMLKSRKIK